VIVIEDFSVAKSPEQVWDYIAVNYFENHPKFDPEVLEMIWRTKPPIAKGTKGSERRKFAGKMIFLDFEVTDFKPSKLLAFKNISGPFYLERNYSIEPTSSGTKVTFVFDMRPKNFIIGLVFPLLKGKFRKSVSDNIQNLKKLLT
jgi:hypothetical protein